MTFKLLSSELVELIYSEVLYEGEVAGRAADTSLDGALARIQNRINYGLIGDAYSLAACYATVISQGHRFNDANKRTAFIAMDTVLALNGIEIHWNTVEVGQKIISLAQSDMDEALFTQWLRDQVAE